MSAINFELRLIMCIDIDVSCVAYIFFQYKNMADFVYTGDAYFKSHNLS